MKNFLSSKCLVVVCLCAGLGFTSCTKTRHNEAPIQGHIQVDGDRLYYEQSGVGHPIILLGGGGMMGLGQWDHQINFLKLKYRVVRMDPRGVGQSDAPTVPFSNADDVRALMDSLRIEKATIVGLSYAGGIALEFAILYPERVCGLVCAGPLVMGWQFSDDQKRRMAVFTDAAQQGPEKFIEVAFKDPHFIPAPQLPKARERARDLIKANFKSVDMSLMKPLTPPVVQQVSQITTPTLLLVGELDHPDIHNRIDFLNQKMRESKKAVIKNSGHIVNMERPEVFNQQVGEFLDNLNCLKSTE